MSLTVFPKFVNTVLKVYLSQSTENARRTFIEETNLSPSAILSTSQSTRKDL